ncbi:secondary metabolite biosynthesis protein [Streptomyces sp. HC44]|uniref:Secondary metabolite biosynthesis protein n=1 Tax=Streptomyces scabichelini TaxID=2711217 RepID=A0A6G4V938_9ACTN|nr:3-oxoacyl-[acyl-carrier-protein] synthase III C-terminal domain-containing protein [Streptomyces scabichelini]NGO10415.1 secondary metabolite biosynthesis protein [Streptomyces scabichelini]
MNDLYVAGVGVHLPARETAAEAIEAGHYDAESARADEVLSACVEPTLFPAEMAAAAGRAALDMAGDGIGTWRAVFHSYVDYQGARYWQAAPYVALHTVGPSVPSFDIVQECNGAMGSIELGRRFITGPEDAVLVTTGDRFDNPWVKRWYGDQSVLADGGSALVLSGARGFAKVRSLVTLAENSLEAEARGGAFGSGADLSLIDFEELRKQFHDTEVPMLEHYGRMETLLHDCVGQVLAEAGVTAAELSYVIPVVTTKWRTEIQLDRMLGLPVERSTWDLGRTTGHVGTGDQFIGLHHLVTTGRVRRGDQVLLLGGGTGYTLTAAVLEIVEDL